MSKRRFTLLLAVLIAIALFFLFGFDDYLSLGYFEQQRAVLNAWLEASPVQAAAAFFLTYIIVTGLSLPGAAVMTLAGGALFGFVEGLVLVSFASTIGATLAFLLSRLLFRDWLQKRFGEHLKAINHGVEKEGALYLFTLRLVPLFPFFVINLLMGLTSIKTRRFFVVSQLGMLPGTVVYVNAGTRLAGIEAPGDLLSPLLLASFVLLGLFPWLARWIARRVTERQRLKAFTRPTQFDTNVIVIGAGSAGLVASLIAATVKARVVLVEKHKMGGDCLNTGCVPSKTFIRSANIRHLVASAGRFGVEATLGGVNFDRVMGRVQETIRRIEPHDSVERYTGLGVDCISGDAQIVSPWQVRVGGRVISAPKIIIATGATPAIPEIPGIDQVPMVTSEDVWQLEQLPRHLLVLGGGPIGCELAQSFARLGSRVSLLHRAPTILPREDADVAAFMSQRFVAEGVELLHDHRPLAFETRDGEHSLRASHGGAEVRVEFDVVLVAVGRRPLVEGLGLDKLGIDLTDRGTIEVDEYMRTTLPTVYACGDVAGPYQFTHMASHQAWYATVNALFGRFRKFKVDYSVVPWATFTDPEVARVGLNERDARAEGVEYELSCYSLEEHDRALAEGDNQGFIKVLTVPGRDRILGATVVGPHGGELINEFVLAMRHKLGLSKILSTIHIYPTWSEANKFVAGNWRKDHAPQRLLAWAEKYHRRVRSG